MANELTTPDASDSPSLYGDLRDPQNFGRLIVESIYKILKVASIYSVQHNQTRLAIQEFMESFKKAARLQNDDSVSLVIRDELAAVNGVTLRLRSREQERLNELRDLFADANIMGIVFAHALSTGQLAQFLHEAKQASERGGGMEHVSIPNIDLRHGQPSRAVMEKLANVTKSMYVAHIYIRGLVKVRNMHAQVRERQDPDIPTGVIRRIMQSVSELLADEDFMILGLLPLRMVPPDLSSHSFNSAIYAMLLADRLGLRADLVSYVGMAVIYQDLDRIVGVSVGQRHGDAPLAPRQQFQTNLRDSAKLLERVGGDVVSTLRVLLTYERGCRFDQPLEAPFYRSSRNIHLSARIIDLARTYDSLIQGLQGYKSRRPDLAVQYIESRAGQAFDSALVELLVSTLGIYPIGTSVELSTGETAIVIRTPDASGDPNRPVLRLLNRQNPTVVDLGDPQFSHISILRSLEVDEDESNAVSEVFLLS